MASTSTEVIPNGMWRSPERIEPGSLVILFESHQSLTYCYVKPGEIFQNRHGVFYHDDMLHKPFGSKVFSRRKNLSGYIIVLAPTPELWSRALRHRTQIVFTLDASAVLFACNLRSGHVVIEAGTGSAALTTAFARTVAPKGKVYTFEFNGTRAETARQEVEAHGMQSVVQVEHRDVCENGFPETLAGTADTVFLDLPCPWKAVDYAHKMLRQGGYFASYSPCIEQVQKTADALRQANFELIRTIETRLVPYSSRAIDLPMPDFGDAEPKEEDVKPAVDTKKKFSKRKRTPEGDTLVAKRDDEIRGHTAFLTFASKFQ